MFMLVYVNLPVEGLSRLAFLFAFTLKISSLHFTEKKKVCEQFSPFHMLST